jgi:uncharacterized Zn finger protein (UPF0148 family)
MDSIDTTDNIPNIPSFPAGMGFSREEADDFLDKVDDVQKQIKDILEGKVDCVELDKREKDNAEKARLKQVSADIKDRERKAIYMKGREGKGHQGGYKTFCRNCFREFTMDGIITCTICGKDTMTLEERMDELKTKLEVHKQKTGKKKTRRGKWENWKKTQEMFYKKTSTNYNKWDMFESSEEEEDPNAEPIVPKNDPAFQAMEQDFE